MRCTQPIDLSIKTASELSKVGFVPRIGRASFSVPCGKCLACKSRRKSEFVFRMDQEKRNGHLLQDGSVRKYKYCFFVTLTYADRFLPRFVPTCMDPRTGEVFTYEEVDVNHTGLLNPLHLRECIKRLRRYYDLDCKMFACGEYGDDGSRPHYHLIFYSDFDWTETKDAFRRAWSMKCPPELRNAPGSFAVQDGKYITWRYSFGRIQVKPVTMRRIRYCAKYIVKSSDKCNPIPKFARVSHHLGTGFMLTTEARSMRQNKRLYALTVDGKPASVGRYFTRRIFRKEELKECVDKFVAENETPPDDSEFGENYRIWFEQHISKSRALYRSSLARQLIPKMCYV